jgi:hypothetical protein
VTPFVNERFGWFAPASPPCAAICNEAKPNAGAAPDEDGSLSEQGRLSHGARAVAYQQKSGGMPVPIAARMITFPPGSRAASG